MLLAVIHQSIAFFLLRRRPPKPTLFPYTTLFRSRPGRVRLEAGRDPLDAAEDGAAARVRPVRTLEDEDRRALRGRARSEEHTSELQSRRDLVCRLLLEKKKNVSKGKACLFQ